MSIKNLKKTIKNHPVVGVKPLVLEDAFVSAIGSKNWDAWFSMLPEHLSEAEIEALCEIATLYLRTCSKEMTAFCMTSVTPNAPATVFSEHGIHVPREFVEFLARKSKAYDAAIGLVYSTEAVTPLTDAEYERILNGDYLPDDLKDIALSIKAEKARGAAPTSGLDGHSQEAQNDSQG